MENGSPGLRDADGESRSHVDPTRDPSGDGGLIVEKPMTSFVEFPPRQRPASYNLEDQVMEQMKDAASAGKH